MEVPKKRDEETEDPEHESEEEEPILHIVAGGLEGQRLGINVLSEGRINTVSLLMFWLPTTFIIFKGMVMVDSWF